MYNLKQSFQQIKLTQPKPQIDQFKLDVQRELGVKETQMYRYFNGSTVMKVDKLEKIISIFEKYGVKQ